jgi:hypothetical protein
LAKNDWRKKKARNAETFHKMRSAFPSEQARLLALYAPTDFEECDCSLSVAYGSTVFIAKGALETLLKKGK